MPNTAECQVVTVTHGFCPQPGSQAQAGNGLEWQVLSPAPRYGTTDCRDSRDSINSSDSSDSSDSIDSSDIIDSVNSSDFSTELDQHL